MTTKCAQCPLKSSRMFAAQSSEDAQVIQSFKLGELSVAAGSMVLLQGTKSAQLFTVLRGMGLRHRAGEHGRRRALNFVLPGDFIGLQSDLTASLTHSVEASTDMTLCVFDRVALRAFFQALPERAFDITWLAARQEHFLGEALSGLDRCGGFETVAWALGRIMHRGAALGLAQDGAMPLPYRQQDLADVLGLSLVHTNKTLAKLRHQGLAHWQDDRLLVPNLEALAQVSGMALDLAGPQALI